MPSTHGPTVPTELDVAAFLAEPGVLAGVLVWPGFFDVDGGLVADPPRRSPDAGSYRDDEHDQADEPPAFSLTLACFLDEGLGLRVSIRSQPVLVQECHVGSIYDTCSMIRNNSSGWYPNLPGELDQFAGLRDDGAALRGLTGDRHPMTTGEFQQALVSERVERTEHRVGVHPEHLGHVPRRWQPLARFCLAISDGPTYRSSDLLMQGDRAVGVDVGLRGGTVHDVIIRFGWSTSTGVADRQCPRPPRW